MPFLKSSVFLILLIIIAGSFIGDISELSVTTINVISGIITLTLGTGLAVAGAMANDSGKGGFFISMFQFMSLSYPLVYIVGLISSISVLYSDIDDKAIIAIWLSLANLIWLLIIAAMFIVAIAIEDINKLNRDRRWKNEVKQQKKPYLIHLPHCGTDIPEVYKADYYLSEDKLKDNIYQYADLYTDELFDPLYQRFGGVKNDYSRLFFDPERFFDDKQEKMSQLGLGWFYEKAILENIPLRDTKNKDAIAQYYINHHKILNKKTQEKLDLYGKCTIIDCHSFSNERYWFHDEGIELPDICIGFDEEHVDIRVVELIQEVFDGYVISINSPYSGSLVPTDYYKKDKNVKSVMLEINKKLYLEENNIERNEMFNDIVFKIDQIMTKLIFHENYKAKELDPSEFLS